MPAIDTFPRAPARRATPWLASAVWLLPLLLADLAAAQNVRLTPPSPSDGEQLSVSDEAAPEAGTSDSPVSFNSELINLDALAADGDAPKCDAPKCDEKKMKELRKKVAESHKPVFYDNKFDYLCDPCYCDWWPGDHFKRICLGECGVLDIGGEYRLRYHDENNFRTTNRPGFPVIRGAGLTSRDDDFLLQRTRIFANADFGCFRAYVEYLDAVSEGEFFRPRFIEENRSDLLNAFGDAKLHDDGCGGQLWARAGRQELIYGNQRTVSPLDWANTRRTFQGYKAFWKSSEWDIDAFWTNPVGIDVHNFDSPNDEQEFWGAYAVYKGCEKETLDMYFLGFLNDRTEFGVTNNFNYYTAGGRWQGSRDAWLWEAEGAYQFGDNTNGTDHSAGFWMAGLGRKFECCCWQPTLWVYYDWASGSDRNFAAAGQADGGNGYHHLFPLAHKYNGFMDLFGRRNLEDANVLLTMKPCEKLTLLAWYHLFWLQNINDTPYSVVMAPYNSANAPQSRELGSEIDLLATYNINLRSNILFGYSHFFAGAYYQQTPLPAGVTDADADFFYTQYTVSF